MPKYMIGDSHAKIDGATYAPGSIVEVTPETAERLMLIPMKDEKPEKLSAADAITEIGKCESVDQVKEFFKGEERPTVIETARAKIKAIKDAGK